MNLHHTQNLARGICSFLKALYKVIHDCYSRYNSVLPGRVGLPSDEAICVHVDGWEVLLKVWNHFNSLWLPSSLPLSPFPRLSFPSSLSLYPLLSPSLSVTWVLLINFFLLMSMLGGTRQHPTVRDFYLWLFPPCSFFRLCPCCIPQSLLCHCLMVFLTLFSENLSKF